MSQIHEKSPKHCAEKQAINLHKFNKKLFFYLSTVLLTILSLILLVWFILHPTKPQFSIKEAGIKQLNLTGPSFLNSTIRLTLSFNNPNKRVGVYYDKSLISASYKGQKITLDASIPPLYQHHEETDTFSAWLIGNQQPVAPYVVYQVQRDQRTGKVALNFKVTGRLRWKVGTWVSGRYRFSVNCITIMRFGPKLLPDSGPIQGSECSTTV